MKLDYSKIGQSIRAHRKKAGLKQRELADQVHVTAQHISHIETGQTQVSLPVLISISDAPRHRANGSCISNLYTIR